MISLNGGEYNEDGSYAEQAPEGAARPKRLLYSYFTAGAAQRMGVFLGFGRGQGPGGRAFVWADAVRTLTRQPDDACILVCRVPSLCTRLRPLRAPSLFLAGCDPGRCGSHLHILQA